MLITSSTTQFRQSSGEHGQFHSIGTIISTVHAATTPYGAFAAAAVDARIVQVTGKNHVLMTRSFAV